MGFVIGNDKKKLKKYYFIVNRLKASKPFFLLMNTLHTEYIKKNYRKICNNFTR